MRMEIINTVTLIGVFCFISPSVVYSIKNDVQTGVCMNSTFTIQPVTQNLILGEGPHWDPRTQKLFFVDIIDKRLLSLDPKNGKVNSVVLDCETVGFVIPVSGPNNRFVVGCNTTFGLITWDGNSSSRPPMQSLTKVDTDRNDTRWNDGKADSKGRFWGGTMAQKINGTIKGNRGTFYKIGSDLAPKPQLTPVSISNGLDWNIQDTIMYYIDSPTRGVLQFDYNAMNGTLSNRRVLYNFGTDHISGVPDGMTVDANGNLWVASYGGGSVLNIDAKSGKLLCIVKIPASQVASVAFGGPMLDTLYVTTAKQDLSQADLAQSPNAGAVFAIKGLKVLGKLPNTFKL